MRMQRIWEADYRHDRRKHAHRCRCCQRILQDGDRALFMKLRSARGTWAVHIECAGKPHPCGTWRDAFAAWTA